MLRDAEASMRHMQNESKSCEAVQRGVTKLSRWAAPHTASRPLLRPTQTRRLRPRTRCSGRRRSSSGWTCCRMTTSGSTARFCERPRVGGGSHSGGAPTRATPARWQVVSKEQALRTEQSMRMQLEASVHSLKEQMNLMQGQLVTAQQQQGTLHKKGGRHH